MGLNSSGAPIGRVDCPTYAAEWQAQAAPCAAATRARGIAHWPFPLRPLHCGRNCTGCFSSARTHALEAGAHAGEQVVNQHGHIAEISQGRVHPRQQVNDVSQRHGCPLRSHIDPICRLPVTQRDDLEPVVECGVAAANGGPATSRRLGQNCFGANTGRLGTVVGLRTDGLRLRFKERAFAHATGYCQSREMRKLGSVSCAVTISLYLSTSASIVTRR